jgi:hypothetical protein
MSILGQQFDAYNKMEFLVGPSLLLPGAASDRRLHHGSIVNSPSGCT